MPNVPLVALAALGAEHQLAASGAAGEKLLPQTGLHELFAGAALLVVDFHMPSLAPARTAFPTVAVDA